MNLKTTKAVKERSQHVKLKPQLLLDKHTPPYSVNIEGVDQMVLISVEVPQGVNTSRGRA